MPSPKLSAWKTTLGLVIATSAILFPSVTSFAQDGATPAPTESASPSPSMSPTPSETATATPTPSVTPTPSPTPTAFNPALYSIDKASSLWVVVDKKRPLNPLNYKPKGLTFPAFKKSASNPYGLRLAKPAAEAIVAMANAMSKAKAGTLVLSSAYRSYNTQVVVHARDVEQLGLIAGERLAARPGYSEHQTGLAADVSAVGQGCVIRVCFSKTLAGKWLAANAWQYGFILRYPSGRTATTGYQFEPWHFRFVGVELSTQMKLTNTAVLEDFFGLPAAPNY